MTQEQLILDFYAPYSALIHYYSGRILGDYETPSCSLKEFGKAEAFARWRSVEWGCALDYVDINGCGGNKHIHKIS